MIKVDENDPIGELEASFPFRDVQIKRGVDVKKYYDLEGELGRGKFGTVFKCKEKGSKLILAAKFIPIERRQDRKNVEHEVDIMRTLQHPRLIQLYDAFELDNVMCVVLELIEGGELFERVIDDDFILTEKSCTIFMRQICEGVEFIHRKNIIHLDLKPENILCLTKTGNRIKIIDFGLARKYEPDKKLQVLFGTPEFVAPEVVNFDQISYETDMWSVGVICYVLLSGLSPFMGDTDVETMSNVTLAAYDFDDEAFDEISADAKDFISKLLVKNKAYRASAGQCLAHPWLKKKTPATSMPLLEPTKEKLKTYVENSSLHSGINLFNDKAGKMDSIQNLIERDKGNFNYNIIRSFENGSNINPEDIYNSGNIYSRRFSRPETLPLKNDILENTSALNNCDSYSDKTNLPQTVPSRINQVGYSAPAIVNHDGYTDNTVNLPHAVSVGLNHDRTVNVAPNAPAIVNHDTYADETVNVQHTILAPLTNDNYSDKAVIIPQTAPKALTPNKTQTVPVRINNDIYIDKETPISQNTPVLLNHDKFTDQTTNLQQNPHAKQNQDNYTNKSAILPKTVPARLNHDADKTINLPQKSPVKLKRNSANDKTFNLPKNASSNRLSTNKELNLTQSVHVIPNHDVPADKVVDLTQKLSSASIQKDFTDKSAKLTQVTPVKLTHLADNAANLPQISPVLLNRETDKATNVAHIAPVRLNQETGKIINLPQVAPVRLNHENDKSVNLPKIAPVRLNHKTDKAVNLPQITPFRLNHETDKTVNLPQEAPVRLNHETDKAVNLPPEAAVRINHETDKAVNLPQVATTKLSHDKYSTAVNNLPKIVPSKLNTENSLNISQNVPVKLNHEDYIDKTFNLSQHVSGINHDVFNDKSLNISQNAPILSNHNDFTDKTVDLSQNIPDELNHNYIDNTSHNIIDKSDDFVYIDKTAILSHNVPTASNEDTYIEAVDLSQNISASLNDYLDNKNNISQNDTAISDNYNFIDKTINLSLSEPSITNNVLCSNNDYTDNAINSTKNITTMADSYEVYNDRAATLTLNDPPRINDSYIDQVVNLSQNVTAPSDNFDYLKQEVNLTQNIPQIVSTTSQHDYIDNTVTLTHNDSTTSNTDGYLKSINLSQNVPVRSSHDSYFDKPVNFTYNVPSRSNHDSCLDKAANFPQNVPIRSDTFDYIERAIRYKMTLIPIEKNKVPNNIHVPSSYCSSSDVTHNERKTDYENKNELKTRSTYDRLQMQYMKPTTNTYNTSNETQKYNLSNRHKTITSTSMNESSKFQAHGRSSDLSVNKEPKKPNKKEEKLADIKWPELLKAKIDAVNESIKTAQNNSLLNNKQLNDSPGFSLLNNSIKNSTKSYDKQSGSGATNREITVNHADKKSVHETEQGYHHHSLHTSRNESLSNSRTSNATSTNLSDNKWRRSQNNSDSEKSDQSTSYYSSQRNKFQSSNTLTKSTRESSRTDKEEKDVFTKTKLKSTPPWFSEMQDKPNLETRKPKHKVSSLNRDVPLGTPNKFDFEKYFKETSTTNSRSTTSTSKYQSTISHKGTTDHLKDTNRIQSRYSDKK